MRWSNGSAESEVLRHFAPSERLPRWQNYCTNCTNWQVKICTIFFLDKSCQWTNLTKLSCYFLLDKLCQRAKPTKYFLHFCAIYHLTKILWKITTQKFPYSTKYLQFCSNCTIQIMQICTIYRTRSQFVYNLFIVCLHCVHTLFIIWHYNSSREGEIYLFFLYPAKVFTALEW